MLGKKYNLLSYTGYFTLLPLFILGIYLNK